MAIWEPAGGMKKSDYRNGYLIIQLRKCGYQRIVEDGKYLLGVCQLNQIH